MGCGTTTIKYTLFFLNFIFALCGILMAIIGGICLAVENAPESTFLQEINHVTPADPGIKILMIVFIVLGAANFMISFFGFCGAIQESNSMMLSYAMLTLVILILQGLGVILIWGIPTSDKYVNVTHTGIVAICTMIITLFLVVCSFVLAAKFKENTNVHHLIRYEREDNNF